MIVQRSFTVEPWAIRETHVSLDRLAQAESVFALAIGHVGIRGNLDEGEPYGMLGTYLGGVYEIRPLPYAEAGYGFPEDGQTVVNVHDGKILRLLVEDVVHAHQRPKLELYDGTLFMVLRTMKYIDHDSLDRANDIVRGALILDRGELMWPPPPPRKVEAEVKESREGSLPTTSAEIQIPASAKSVATRA